MACLSRCPLVRQRQPDSQEDHAVHPQPVPRRHGLELVLAIPGYVRTGDATGRLLSGFFDDLINQVVHRLARCLAKPVVWQRQACNRVSHWNRCEFHAPIECVQNVLNESGRAWCPVRKTLQARYQVSVCASLKRCRKCLPSFHLACILMVS